MQQLPGQASGSGSELVTSSCSPCEYVLGCFAGPCVCSNSLGVCVLRPSRHLCASSYKWYTELHCCKQFTDKVKRLCSTLPYAARICLSHPFESACTLPNVPVYWSGLTLALQIKLLQNNSCQTTATKNHC